MKFHKLFGTRFESRSPPRASTQIPSRVVYEKFQQDPQYRPSLNGIGKGEDEARRCDELAPKLRRYVATLEQRNQGAKIWYLTQPPQNWRDTSPTKQLSV